MSDYIIKITIFLTNLIVTFHKTTAERDIDAIRNS